MSALSWVVLVAAVLGVLAVYLSWTAGRLDRQHARLDASRAVLDAQLLRRSGAALDLATSGILDPAASMLVADAASRARTESEQSPEQVQSDLTAVLGAALDDPAHLSVLSDDPATAATLNELAGACRRVAHARRFHNVTVSTVRRLRGKPVVRLLRLAGHAERPEPIEFDDAVPAGLPS